MSEKNGNSPSKYNHLLSRKPSHIGNTEVLSSISYLWEYDQIKRLENNQWKCLWCNVIFQSINATNALDHIIGKKMHIKICQYSIYQYNLSIYKVLQHTKASKKGLINDYLHNIISSVSRL